MTTDEFETMFVYIVSTLQHDWAARMVYAKDRFLATPAVLMLLLGSCQMDDDIRITLDNGSILVNGNQKIESDAAKLSSADLRILNNSVRSEFKKTYRRKSYRGLMEMIFESAFKKDPPASVDFCARLELADNVPCSRLWPILLTLYGQGFSTVNLFCGKKVQLSFPPNSFDDIVNEIEVEDGKITPIQTRQKCGTFANYDYIPNRFLEVSATQQVWVDSDRVFLYDFADSVGQLIRNRDHRYDVERLTQGLKDSMYIGLNAMTTLSSSHLVQAVDALTAFGKRNRTFYLQGLHDFNISGIGTVELASSRSSASDSARARSVFDLHAQELIVIYNRTLQKLPFVSGQMQMRVHLDLTGRVSSLYAFGLDDEWGAGLKREIAAAIKKWTFPTDAKKKTIVFSLVFAQYDDPKVGRESRPVF